MSRNMAALRAADVESDSTCSKKKKKYVCYLGCKVRGQNCFQKSKRSHLCFNGLKLSFGLPHFNKIFQLDDKTILLQTIEKSTLHANFRTPKAFSPPLQMKNRTETKCK